MENTIRFPNTNDVQIQQYNIYKEIKNIESVTMDHDFTYLLLLCAQGVVHVYDNITKLKLGKIEFLEVLKHNSLYSAVAKSLNEKDKSKIIDSVAFCKNPNWIAFSSSKLSTIFLVKTNFTSLVADVNEDPRLVAFVETKSIASRDSPLGFVMDPYSKYGFLAFNQGVVLGNFSNSSEHKVELEIEMDLTSKKEGLDDKVIAGAYLDRYCSKTEKKFVVCVQEQISVYRVEFDKKSEMYKNIEKLTSISTGTHLKMSFVSVNHTNEYLAVRNSKKSAKIYRVEIEGNNAQIIEHYDFEAGEGRTWHEIFFNVYDNSSDAHEQWAVLLEKNTHGFGLIFHHLEKNQGKDQPRAILDSNLRLKRAYANFPWRNAVLGITDYGSLVVLEIKMPPSWINFAYKFTFTNDNIEYIEREDEFDKKDDDLKIDASQWDRNAFNELPKGSLERLPKKKLKFSEIKIKKEEFFERDEVKEEEDGSIIPEENRPILIEKEKIEEEEANEDN